MEPIRQRRGEASSGRSWGHAVSGTDTHCPYCSLQCGITLTAQPDGTIALVGRADFPVNRGGLCIKGATAAELLDHPERLTIPLVRDARDAPFRPATWDDALDRIAGAIRCTQAEHGRDAVGAFGGGGLTNEKAYQFGKFVRVALGSRNIDYNGRFCMSSAVAAGTRAFGIDRGLPFPFDDIPLADVVVLVGSNPADTMPPVMRFLDEGRERGARHVVIDPRRTATAELAHTHLQPVPNTDLSLAIGLLHIAIRENLVDEEYISTRTNGFDAVRRAVRSYWPDRVERVTGIAVPDLYDLVRSLAAPPTAMILTARGVEQHADGTDTAQAWINLALALGLPGRGPGSGWGTITGQGNGQGGREHGQKADQLPGYRQLKNPVDRAHVAAVWGVDPDELPGPGVSAYELLDRVGTDAGVRTLLVSASNPVVSAPNARHVVERLRALDFLAVTDIFLSETAAMADVVLPTTQWAEETGTMTNPEGRVLLRRQAVDPPPGTRSDLQIWRGIADRLGRGEFFPTDPEGVFAALRRASAGGVADYAGITYRRAARRGPSLPAHDRAVPLAVPVGRADAPEPDAGQGGAAALRRAAPGAGPRPRHRRGRPGAPVDPAWQRRARRAPARRRAPRHRVRPVPLGRCRVRERVGQRRAGPDLADAGVQDVPRRRREGRAPS